jgi:hypothetical protein
MTNLAHRAIGDYGALGNRELELLRGDQRSDCKSKDLRQDRAVTSDRTSFARLAAQSSPSSIHAT